MNKIDEAMELMQKCEGCATWDAVFAKSVRAILENVFRNIPDCTDCDLTIAYMKGFEDGKDSKPVGTIITAGGVSVTYTGEQPVPQDVEAEIHTRLAETFSEDWCDRYGNAVGDIIRPYLAVNDRSIH